MEDARIHMVEEAYVNSAQSILRMTKSIILFIAVLFIYQNVSFAQAYSGGEGSGSVSLRTQLIDTCRFFFTGGVQSGTALSQRTAPNRCFSFFGEQASGFDKIAKISNFDCNLFNGSLGHGFSTTQFINPYTCISFVASNNGHDGFA